MAKLVSQVYGDALFEEAVERDSIEEWYEDVTDLKETFKANPDLGELLNHPQIPKEDKISVIENIFRDNLPAELTGFLIVIVDKNRQKYMEEIFDHFLDRVKEYENIGVAEITSAVELSGEQREKIEKKILETTSFKSLEASYKVDEELLGGIKIRIGDRVVDSTVKTRLDKLTAELLSSRIA